jgi:hypothetical protein
MPVNLHAGTHTNTDYETLLLHDWHGKKFTDDAVSVLMIYVCIWCHICLFVDHQLTAASGMKLRHRVITREKFDELVTSDESSEDDSDESDNWVMPKSRKNKSIKRKRMNLVHSNSFKKQHTSEEVYIIGL